MRYWEGGEVERLWDVFQPFLRFYMSNTTVPLVASKYLFQPFLRFYGAAYPAMRRT